MNTIILSYNTQIQIESADIITANAPFYHIDRIAPFHVLIYCIKGCIYVAEDDTEYEIKPGECLIMKSGHHQKPTMQIKEGTSWVYTHFFTQDFNIASASGFYLHGMYSEVTIPQYSSELMNSEFEDLLYSFIEEIHSDNIVKKLHSAALFQKILLTLYEKNTENRKTELHEDIISYLNRHIKEQITCHNLEQHFHLTYKYMERVFKNNVGISIMQYHIKQKINESAKLLRSTSASVSEISEIFGFNDQLYFSRCFKKHMGVSPMKYRVMEIKI